MQARDAEIEALRDALHEAQREQDLRIGDMAARHEAERMDAAAAIRQLQDELQAATAHQHHLVDGYVNSTSWRLTRPLRIARRFVRGGPAALVRPAPPSPAPAALVLPFKRQQARPHRQTAKAGQGLGPAQSGSNLGLLKPALRRVQQLRLDAFLASGDVVRLPSPEQPAVSIVLVLYNQAELTFACLTSIMQTQAAGECGIELVIVDNASTDATAALLDRVQGATILRNADNRHFLRAMNQGADAVRGPAMLLLNNDAQLLPGSLASALRTLRSAPDIGAVGGRIILPDGTLQEAGSIIWQSGACAGYGRGADPASPEYTFQRDVDYCSGAFLLTWTALWRQLGGLDERYAPAYYEETDFCVRLWKAEFRVVFDPRAAILHHEFGSSARSADALALQAANHELFRATHAAWLQDQRPMEAGSLLARTARTTGLRVLVVDDHGPGEAARIGDLLDRGAAVTLLLAGDAPARPAGLDPRVEVTAGVDAAGLLASRPGFFSAVVLPPGGAAADLQAQLAAEPGLAAGAVVLETGPGGGLAAFLATSPAPDRVTRELPASRPADSDFAMAVPFGFAPLAGPAPRIAVICHLYHPEVATELLPYLGHIAAGADLYVSTDTEAKRAVLQAALGGWDRGRVELTVMPNRGRDIAPKLVGFAAAHAGYDLVLHLHSKKSDHTAFLAPWRRYLFETLLGSPAVVASITDAFARLPRLGILAPQHYEAIRRWIGWQGNLPQARLLAERMGVLLQPGRALDFPSGSMFWARPVALRPLLDLGLRFGDFPDEGEQQDHTTAHAIERLFFYACEKSGHDWLKVADPALVHDAGAIVPIPGLDDLLAFAGSHRVQLTGTGPIAVRPDPAPMRTGVAPGLAARLAAAGWTQSAQAAASTQP